MTSQNTSIFPMVALALAILLQVEVLIFFTKQVTEPSRQRSFIIFYTGAMLISVILMKFFQIFQTEQLMYIPCSIRRLCAADSKSFCKSSFRDNRAIFQVVLRYLSFIILSAQTR